MIPTNRYENLDDYPTRKISHAEFKAELDLQGVERDHYAFSCPSCKTVQSMASLMKTGMTSDDARVNIGFSCIGRYTGAGPWKRGDAPGKGCDWTLGGLFKIHQLEIVDSEGRIHPYFKIATPEQAQALKTRITS